MPQHSLVLVGRHHILCRSRIPCEWISGKIRFGQTGVGFVALLFDETDLELEALRKVPFRSCRPTHLGDAVGFGKPRRLVPRQVLEPVAAQLHPFQQGSPCSLLPGPMLHHAEVAEVATVPTDF